MRPFFALLLYIVCAHTASAQVVISEIHYNPVGTDDKHEYVEICNTGSSAVDVAGYKLYESSSNHALTLSRGSSNLGQSACAVLVIDPPTFMADFPAFSAALFDASFSLSNSGEALILRDTGGADVDGISYTPTQGGNGDGQSLHRTGTTFVGGTPSPGSEPGLVATVGTATSGPGGTTSGTGSTADSGPTTGATSTTVFHTVTVEPPARLYVRTKELLEAATLSVVTFMAETYNAKGASEDAQCTWVYGDGIRDATAQGSGVRTHTYTHPGEYEAVVTCTKQGLTAESLVRVVVRDNPLTLEFIDDERGVAVRNTGTKPVDLTGVRLANTSQTYTFPDKTRVLGGQSLRFTLADIGLTEARRPKELSLVYAGGKRVTIVGEPAQENSAPYTNTRSLNEPMALTSYVSESTKTTAELSLAKPIAPVPTTIFPQQSIQSKNTRPSALKNITPDKVVKKEETLREEGAPAPTPVAQPVAVNVATEPKEDGGLWSALTCFLFGCKK